MGSFATREPRRVAHNKIDEMDEVRVVNTACKECPFKRTSTPGYLGSASYEPENFLRPFWYGDQRLPCHMQINWKAENVDHQARTAPLCRGALTMMRNACKMPYNAEMVTALEAIEVNTTDFFNWEHEFCSHHGRHDDDEN